MAEEEALPKNETGLPVDDKTLAAATDAVFLPSGNALKRTDIYTVTRRRYTPIVFLAGDIQSGKTTLLASINDKFQFGPFGDYSFAGCETMMALEERSFESRVRSGNESPDTPRTRYLDGQEYLHLRLRKSVLHPFQELLFADMSGEFYERAVLNDAELQEFQILKRSDFLVLLLDGKKLLDSGLRHAVRNDASTFIRRCVEKELLAETTALQVVISKWDMVVARGATEMQNVQDFVSARLNSAMLGRTLTVTPIAARPDASSPLQPLYGVEPLFPIWVESVALPFQSTQGERSISSSSRLFNRLREEL